MSETGDSMKRLLVISIFAAAVCIFCWEVLFGGRVLLDANPFHLDPWRAHATEENLTGKTYRTDSFLTYLPRWVEMSRSLRSGRFPLWNPYVFAGTPFHADPQSRTVYPLALLLALADPLTTMGLDVALHFFIALLGMYLFLRAIGATSIGSMIGAFSFGFSSFFYVRIGHPTFVASASWIPFFFYGLELARRPGRKGTVLLAVFLAMGYLAGFPQVFAFGVAALVFYAFWLSIDRNSQTRQRNILKTARILLISGGLSLLLVSVQLVPFLEMLRNSTGLGVEFEEMRQIYLTPPVLLLRSLFPNFFGNPVEGTDWSDLTREAWHTYKPDFAVYCGIGSLMLALGCLVFIRKSAKARAFFLILALSMGMATSPLLLRLAYGVFPLIRISKVSRISVLACFAASALSGLGFSMISSSTERHLRRAFLAIVSGVVVVILAISVLFTLAGDSVIADLSEKARSLPEDTWQRRHPVMRSGMIKEWSEGDGSPWLAYEKRQIRRSVWPAFISLVLICLWVWHRPARTRLGALAAVSLLICIGVDIGLTARTYFVSQPAPLSLETEGITFLKNQIGGQGRWRRLSLRPETRALEVLEPNTNQIFEIPSLGGTATMVPEGYARLWEEHRIRVRTSLLEQATPMPIPDIVVNDLMSVRYITVKPAPRLSHLSSPVFRGLLSEQHDLSRLRILDLDDGSRLALCQAIGESIRFEIDLRPARSLDFVVGFDGAGGTAGDSLRFSIVCESRLGKVGLMKGLDLWADRGRWYPLRLDISTLSGHPGSITLSVASEYPDGKSTVSAGWTEFEFVLRDCEVKQAHQAYQIEAGVDPQVLSLRLTSEAREVPLEILRAGPERTVRWVAFPDHMPSRRVLVDLRGEEGGTVAVRSDSSFVLKAARMTSAGDAYLDYHLVYDGDMQIYENVAAVEKGICIDKRGTRMVTADGSDELEVTLGDIDRLRCGRCNIVSYEPEEVVLQVSAWRDCYLLFQDIHYPGWKAYDDGRETEIMKTELGVRAIEVARGNHEIVMQFKPRSLTIGMILTLLGIALTVVYPMARRSS